MRKLTLVSIILATVLLVFGSVSAQDDDMMMMDGTLYATLNPADLENDAIVTLGTDLMDTMTTFDGFEGIASVQSVKFTSDGTAYVTVDVAEGQGGLLVVDGMGMADSMAVGMGSRMISGETAGLVSPKGLEIIEDLGVVVVANFGAGNITAFNLDAEGDAEPALVLSDFGGVEGSIWDVHYDADTDTLFAAGTTGTLFVYNSFSEMMGESGPDSSIVPSDADGNQISINLHGVEYDAMSDTVILSDVGAADDNTDGQLFTISAISEASGNTTVDLAIGGPESQLGNPVDIAFDGSGIYVAEKANDFVAYYADILGSMGMMDGAATTILDISKPESVTFLSGMDMMMDDGMDMGEDMADEDMGDDEMMGDMMMMDATLYATLNPADLENDAIVTLGTDLMDTMTTFDGFDGIASVQSVKFTSDGTAYVTVDVAEGQGGIVVVDGMGMADSMAVGMGSRMIGGVDAAGLVSPKGLEIIEELDLVLVANFGASNIKGFSLSAEGDVAPTVFIDDLAGVGGSIWDVHYDADTDTLFAAGTTGTLFLFSNFSADLGANGPTSTVVPSDADGNQISINLHGVEYDAMSDTVILSDVGAADDNTDGQLFTISAVSEASGNTTVDLAIGGPESQLGNPVDIAFDGSGIYVAEKANDFVAYYADILGSMGMMDGTATTILDISKPESVTLVAAMGDM